MIAGLICLIIAADQLVKYIIRCDFQEGETLPVIQDVFHITYVRNRGAAFSMFQNQPFITILIPVIFMVACLVFLIWARKNHESRIQQVAVAMILAGGTGNLIDRIVLGYVTDMFIVLVLRAKMYSPASAVVRLQIPLFSSINKSL